MELEWKSKDTRIEIGLRQISSVQFKLDYKK